MYSTPGAGPSRSVGFIFSSTEGGDGTFSNFDPQLLDDPPSQTTFVRQSVDGVADSNIDPQLLNDPSQHKPSIEKPPEPSGNRIPTNKAEAPLHALPQNQFFSIEYPGYLKSTTTSVDHAIHTLGGSASLETAFKRSKTKGDALFECHLRPENPFAHPIPGDVVATNNIVLKVTKRKRKGKGKEKEKDLSDLDGDGDVRMEEGKESGSEAGRWEFVAEAVGVINNTVRFRSMVDYQYSPDPADPVTQLRSAMDRMDVQSIKNFVFQPEKEDYAAPIESSQISSSGVTGTHRTPNATAIPSTTTSAGTNLSNDEPLMRSNLRMFPPPMFSRQGLPHLYNYKANAYSVVSTSVDEVTGAEKKRLINKTRYRGLGPITISYADKPVPTKPPNIPGELDSVDKKLIRIMRALFEERPVWTRSALLNQLSANDARAVQNSKPVIPNVCYVFSDGPWRDTLLRLGYDPREDPSARFYQRIYFRNLNHPVLRPSIANRRTEPQRLLGITPALNRSRVSDQTEEDLPNSNDGKETDTNTVEPAMGSEIDPNIDPNLDSESPATNAKPGAKGRSTSHIFDGIHLSKETAAFQLCDITDAMLEEMIEDENAIRDECDEHDGWYTTHALERIKTLLRHKFFSLLEGHIATPEECRALLDPSPTEPSVVVTRSGPRIERLKRKPGKHNMAKGALPPEEAAAVRLRAALDKNVRENLRGGRRDPDQ